MTATMLRTSDPHNVTSLIDFALDSLPAMQHKDGAFCFERRVGNPAPLGRSPRYTLMVELGLLRAQTAGYTLPINPDELNTIAWRELHTGNLTPGDIGLMLWTDARRDGRSGHKLAEHLTHALQTNGGLQARLGMELGWIITGLAHHQATNPSQPGARLPPKPSTNSSLTTAHPPACSDTSATPAGDAASPTSPPKSTPYSPSRPSPATTSTTAPYPQPPPPPTNSSTTNSPTAAGPGSTTPNAATSSNNTKSTPSTKTPWPPWPYSNSPN